MFRRYGGVQYSASGTIYLHKRDELKLETYVQDQTLCLLRDQIWGIQRRIEELGYHDLDVQNWGNIIPFDRQGPKHASLETFHLGKMQSTNVNSVALQRVRLLKHSCTYLCDKSLKRIKPARFHRFARYPLSVYLRIRCHLPFRSRMAGLRLFSCDCWQSIDI